MHLELHPLPLSPFFMEDIICCTPPESMPLSKAFEKLRVLPVVGAICRNQRSRLIFVTCQNSNDGDQVDETLRQLGFTIHESLAVKFLRWLTEGESLGP